MHLRQLAVLTCLAAICSLAAAPAPSPTPHAPKPVPGNSPISGSLPAPIPSPPRLPSSTCDKQMTVGEVTLCSNEFNFNFKTGDVQFPMPLHGRTSDGTYKADRGYGNLHAQIINLIGHVVVHRDATRDKQGKPVAPLTLTADQTHIESKAKFYRASGNVKIVRGDQTMTAPQITLDENTHVADLSGGVHAEQPPNRSFDAAEVFYNTETQDFKAVGSVRMQFPANQPGPAGSPRPTPTPRAGAKPRASTAPSASPAAPPAPSPAQSAPASAAPASTASP